MMWGDMQIVEEMDKMVGTIVEHVVEYMEKKIKEMDRERVLCQVNLRMAEMQLENMEADEKGESKAHALDNITRLNIFFEISGDNHHLSEAQKVRDESRSGDMVQEEENVKVGAEEGDVMDTLAMKITVEMENVGETGEGDDFVTADEKGEDSDRVLDEGLVLDADSFSQDTDKVFDKIVRDLDKMFLMNEAVLERNVNKFRGCVLFNV